MAAQIELCVPSKDVKMEEQERKSGLPPGATDNNTVGGFPMGKLVGQGSPGKVNCHGRGSLTSSGVSPQGKGVGIFGFEGSPTGALMDATVKEPKLEFVSPSAEEFDVLRQQMKARMEEGQGEAIYEIGIGGGCSCNGLSPAKFHSSLDTVHGLAAACGADMMLLRERAAKGGTIAECLVRRKVDEDDFLEVRVAVVGNVDAGKSTLLGVLTHGALDNGRGVARQRLFRHKHEMETGRTSSVGNDILGFDGQGRVVNKTDGHGGLDWVHICQSSAKVVTFIDLAGHEKYLKTTIFGMTGHAPDYCMLMIGSNAGIIGMTKEHLGLALALSVPVFVVVTKIDMCPPNVLQDTMKLLARVLKSPGCRKIPVLVQTQDDVITSASNFTSERICPIFQVSNVTGENLELLTSFLNLLSGRMTFNEDKPAEFQIDETYSVPGVGTVVSGTCMQGVIQLNDTLLIGPTSLGEFVPISIRGIQRKRLPVRAVRGGQTASFALKKIRRSQIRKGMVMVDPSLEPTACWEFEGEILVLHHPTTISPKYQAMVHCGSTRQTASIIHMDKEHLRTGDKATCHFRFIKNPEYLKPSTRMVFREGRTKAVGNITKIIPYVPGTPVHGGKGKPSSGVHHRYHHHHHHGVGGHGGRSKGRRGKRNRSAFAATAIPSDTASPGGGGIVSVPPEPSPLTSHGTPVSPSPSPASSVAPPTAVPTATNTSTNAS